MINVLSKFGDLCQKVLTRERLTAPHYLAYRWVLENLPPLAEGDAILDFGSKASLLPGLLSQICSRVIACDRDPFLAYYQGQAARELEVKRTWSCCENLQEGVYRPLLFADESFQVITTVWSIQHNFPLQSQTEILKDLCRLLKPGGSLLVVSSCTVKSESTREDIHRADPQIIVSVGGHRSRAMIICRNLGLKRTAESYFRYEHGTAIGDYCSSEEANAICIKLEKLERNQQ